MTKSSIKTDIHIHLTSAGLSCEELGTLHTICINIILWFGNQEMSQYSKKQPGSWGF